MREKHENFMTSAAA